MGTPKGSIYAELDVTDPDTFYGDDMKAVRPILADYGAKFLIATNDVKVIEGNRKVKRVILLEFDSAEQANAFFYSEPLGQHQRADDHGRGEGLRHDPRGFALKRCARQSALSHQSPSP